MQQGDTSTRQDSLMKRVSVRSGGAGHALSGVAKGPDSRNGASSGAALDRQANVLRSASNIVVRLGT